MIRFINNTKQNNILNEIYNDIKDNESLTIDELKRYKKEFPNESDYNIVQYGNLLVYYYDVRQLFERCGYKNAMKTDNKGRYILSDGYLWDYYKDLVKQVVNYILKNEQ